MYPRYGPAGGGLLRLHSTYRHDLKIYSSDEGRVQMSAAAFTQARSAAVAYMHRSRLYCLRSSCH